jgi:hypothetical protein
LEVAKKRGFYSWTKEPQEKTARRSEVQRRTADKRRAQDLIKVQTAFEALKYDSTFLLVMTGLRRLPAPRQMSKQPTFPELVVYLLPEKEWIYLVPPQYSPANTRRSTNNVSRSSRLDSYHYQLLSTHPDCDRTLLEAAYKDWLKLEEYEDGKVYGESLLNDIAPFGVAKNLFEEIMSRLMAGSNVDQVKFKEKWIQKGLTEAGRSKEWSNFQVVQKGIFDVKVLEDSSSDTSYKIQWKSPMLGRNLKSSKKRRKSRTQRR